MLAELGLVLDHVEKFAKVEEYKAAIIDDNILGKPTQATRRRTAERLIELYALAPKCSVFRLLRHFWNADILARPLLAYLAAAARDPVLRGATPFVLALPFGSALSPSQTVSYLEEIYPKRFRESTGLATAQRLGSSWTHAGYLKGKVNKKRGRTVVSPVSVAFSFVLGYLGGCRGKMLLDTVWTRMLDRTPPEISALAHEASSQGWLSYKAAGSIVEITFPGLLTTQEEKASHEPD